MNWRDLLYFSKGERRALILLFCLIVTAGILLIIKDIHEAKERTAALRYTVQPAPETGFNKKAPIPVNSDTITFQTTKQQKQKNTNIPNKKEQYFNKRKYNSFPKTEKYPVGTIVELNTADTTILKKVPGIGSVYAKRIVKYRKLLGGFYTVSQLREVYGMDKERYQSLHTWFHADPSLINKLPVNNLSVDSLVKHPYINYKQAKIIYQLRKQKGRLSGWKSLFLLEEFNETDKERLHPYLSFTN